MRLKVILFSIIGHGIVSYLPTCLASPLEVVNDLVSISKDIEWVRGSLEDNIPYWYPKGKPTEIVFQDPTIVSSHKNAENNALLPGEQENALSTNSKKSKYNIVNILDIQTPTNDKDSESTSNVGNLISENIVEEQYSERFTSPVAHHGAAAESHTLRQQEQQRLRVLMQQRRLDVFQPPENPIFAYLQTREYNYDDIEAGSTVTRGPDWKWDNQDGGIDFSKDGQFVYPKGIVMEVTWWSGEVARDKYAVRVKWDNGGYNIYRYGAEDSRDVVIVGNRGEALALNMLSEWRREKRKKGEVVPASPSQEIPTTAVGTGKAFAQSNFLIPATNPEENSLPGTLPKIDDAIRYRNRCHPEEKKALLEIFYALDGPNWISNSGWMASNSDPCYAGGAATAKYANKSRGYMYVLFFFQIRFCFVRNFVPNDFF